MKEKEEFKDALMFFSQDHKNVYECFIKELEGQQYTLKKNKEYTIYYPIVFKTYTNLSYLYRFEGINYEIIVLPEYQPIYMIVEIENITTLCKSGIYIRLHMVSWYKRVINLFRCKKKKNIETIFF